MEPYLLEGELTEITHYPHAVYLIGFCDVKYFCGASVLNQEILLTAAHCADNCKLSNHYLDTFAGSTVIEEAKVLRRVSNYVIHEDYNPAAISPNICLLVLTDKLPLGDNIKRVSIPPWNSLYEYGTVAGWGVTEVNEEDQQDITRLRKTVIRILSWSECQRSDHLVRQGMLCGELLYEHSGPSAGDSGSAFVVDQLYQIGIVSFRADEGHAVVFTNVSYYKDWIEKNSQTLYCY